MSEQKETSLAPRAGAELARKEIDGGGGRIFEALRSDFRRQLPAVRAFGFAGLITGLALFAAAVVSLLAGGPTILLITRTIILAAYSAGAFYVAIVLLGGAESIDRALQSGYTLEFEAMFLKERKSWQRLAATAGAAVAIAIGAILVAGGIGATRYVIAAQQQALTRARMERIVAALELYAISHRSYPNARSVPQLEPMLVPTHADEIATRDAWDGAIVYVPQCAAGRCASFRLVSAGADRRWNTGDDITVRARVMLK